MKSAFPEIQRPNIFHCEPGWSWNPAPFRDFDFWLVLSGRGTLKMGGKSCLLGGGSCFLFQPGDAPKAGHDPADPLVVFACHFWPAGLRAGKRIRKDPIHVDLDEFEFLRRSGELAARVFEEGKSGRNLAAAIVGQMTASVFHAADRGPREKESDPRLTALALEIRGQPARAWTVAEMARRCALSVPQFNRRFRQAFRCSPIQYVIRLRVLRAIALLRESDMPLQQIAESIGYSDLFFFHRQFRQVTGTTPRAVRLGAATALDAAPQDGCGIKK